MLFAWQGLQLEHPGDWAPLALSGDRKQGYVRISSPDKGFLQVRWQRGSGLVTERTIEQYLAKLAGDAKRSKSAFSSQTKLVDSKIHYSYKSDIAAKGILFPFQSQNGLVFLEAVNTSNAVLRCADSSFKVQDSPLEHWSLHGLNILLPSSLRLDSHELKAGKTALQLSGNRMRVVAERWGFAEMLLAQRSLADWTQSLCGLPHAEIEPFASKVSLYQKRTLLPDVWVKAAVQEELNQITVIRVESRRPDLQPQWNWFAH